jgi:hypothetical protein
MHTVGLAPQYTDVLEIADRMWDVTLNNQGGTFNARTGISRNLGNNGGYVVANNTDSVFIHVTECYDIAVHVIAKFLQRQPTYGDGHKDDIGTWLHDGLVYIDTVEYVHVRADALERGRKYNQIAIWDIANACEITVDLDESNGLV